MESNPERPCRDPGEGGSLRRPEPQHVHHHDRLTVRRSERGECALQVDPSFESVTGVFPRWVDDLDSGATEEPCACRLEQDPVRDAEEPCPDTRIPSEADGRGTGADEGFLRQLLGVARIPDDPQEVGVDLPLVGSEYVLEIHVPFTLCE